MLVDMKLKTRSSKDQGTALLQFRFTVTSVPDVPYMFRNVTSLIWTPLPYDQSVGTISWRLYGYTVNPKIIAAIDEYMRLGTVTENNVAERPLIARNQL
nr:hypothetical protein Itr_chr13CG20370 [Ipomoea trifida]